MELVFDDNLITGNELIDTQHKELISRISRFVASCEAGEQNKVQAIKMLDYMMRWCSEIRLRAGRHWCVSSHLSEESSCSAWA